MAGGDGFDQGRCEGLSSCKIIMEGVDVTPGRKPLGRPWGGQKSSIGGQRVILASVRKQELMHSFFQAYWATGRRGQWRMLRSEQPGWEPGPAVPKTMAPGMARSPSMPSMEGITFVIRNQGQEEIINKRRLYPLSMRTDACADHSVLHH